MAIIPGENITFTDININKQTFFLSFTSIISRAKDKVIYSFPINEYIRIFIRINDICVYITQGRLLI